MPGFAVPHELDLHHCARRRAALLFPHHRMARAMHAAMTRAWLIGAGPGDVELMTLKATRALAQADVVLVDDLVSPDVLQFARTDALIVHVGKRGGHPSTPQADIVAQMLAHLRAGRSVARLKGGDPFVFGRGGEELQALHAAGIDAQVISGITAGIAAPAALGIPVTHRGYAQGVVFVTGHAAGGDEPDWAALAATRMTLVIYMGMRRLGEIAGALLAAGMSGDTPCAAIEAATRPEQRHALAPLGELADTLARTGLGSPAIVVIGAVASLALARDAAQLEHAAHTDGSACGKLADATQHRHAMKTLSVGIGCRLHTPAADIEAAVRAALKSYAFEQIGTIATIDSKAHEAGLLDFCLRHALPLRLFTREQIAAVPLVSRSAAAHAHVGVDGVCEPCALLAAQTLDAATASRPARLAVRKTVHAGVTVAIASCGDDADTHAASTPTASNNQDLR